MIIRPPSPQLLAIAQGIDDAVGQLLKARGKLSKELTKYESTHDSLNLMFVAIRHIEAVAQLARHDVVLGQTAMTLARAALESSVRALWMVDDNNYFQRERRWCALTDEEIRGRRRAAKYASAVSPTGAVKSDPIADTLERFLKGIDPLFPKGTTKIASIPTMEQMMRDVKVKANYFLYVIASQIVHGTLWATNAYRGGLGSGRAPADRVTEQSWLDPLVVVCAVLTDPIPRVLVRLGVKRKEAMSEVRSKALLRRLGAFAACSESNGKNAATS
jgi:hypothetical protein